MNSLTGKNNFSSFTRTSVGTVGGKVREDSSIGAISCEVREETSICALDGNCSRGIGVNGEMDGGTIEKAGCGSRNFTKSGTVSDAGNSGIVTNIGSDTDKGSASNIRTAGGTKVGAESETGNSGGVNAGSSGNIGIYSRRQSTRLKAPIAILVF